MKLKEVETNIGSIFEGTRFLAECVPLEDSTTAEEVAAEIALRINAHDALVEALKLMMTYATKADSKGVQQAFAALEKAGVK